MKIAVIGGGVAGIVAAHLLQCRHDVTLFERGEVLGGHSNTVDVEDPEAGTIPVDTGFIVYNERTYPLFTRFLAHLAVATQPSDMSFGFCDEMTGLEYAGTNLNTLFAQRANLLRPSMWRMVRDILRFNRIASADATAQPDPALPETLGTYLAMHGFSPELARQYLIPMCAAIWSASDADIECFPLRSFLTFFHNHGLLTVNGQPQWRTVTGGSREYIRAFARRFRGEIRTGFPVQSVERRDSCVCVTTAGTRIEEFDAAVLAAHADTSLSLLANPTDAERELLGAARYSVNEAVLHSDESLLPRNPRARASWNYCRDATPDPVRPVTLTYDMKRLQNLPTRRRYSVTLNSGRPIAPGTEHYRTMYTHPIYSPAFEAVQRELPSLNGADRLHFCGSYFGYGFHEDAVRSAVHVAESFGCPL